MPGDTGALPSLLVNSTVGVWVSHTELLSTARTGETVSNEHMKSRNKRKSHCFSLPPIRPRDWVRASNDRLQSFHRIIIETSCSKHSRPGGADSMPQRARWHNYDKPSGTGTFIPKRGLLVAHSISRHFLSNASGT